MPRTGSKTGPAPWPVPQRRDNDNDKDEDEDEEDVTPKSRTGSVRILPDGTQVSDNIFRRIMSLGLDSEVQYVSSHRRSRSDEQYDRHHYSSEKSPSNSRVMNSNVTFVESDDEVECEPAQRTSSKRANVEPQRLDLGKMAQDYDNSSSSEGDDPASSPRYSVWLSPPHFPDYKESFSEIEKKAQNVEEEPAIEYGIDILEVESPRFDSSDFQEQFAKSNNSSSEKPSSSNSSMQRSDTSSNLKSETELQRLDAYLRRQKEEEKAKREREEQEREREREEQERKREKEEQEREREKARRQQTKSPRITRQSSDGLPKRLDISQIEDIVEEFNFTPISTAWEGSFNSFEPKEDNPQQSHRASDVQTKPQNSKPEAQEDRYSAADEQALSVHKRPPSIDRQALSVDRQAPSIDRRPSGKVSLDSRSTLSKRPSGSAKLQRSSSVLGLARSRTASKLIRSVSFRRARAKTPSKITAVRAAALQRELSSGFDGEESQRTLFYMKADVSNAVRLVAETCQRHLRLAVYQRHSGDKLRVESSYPGGVKLKMSVSFQEKQDGLKGVTLVKVRPSRMDRGNKSLSRVFEFYKSLVTQLDIEGHIVSANST